MKNGDPEAERRRRTTRHLRVSLAAVLLFGLAIVGLYWAANANAPRPGPAPSPTATATGSPPPSASPTLLIQVTGTDGAVGNVMTGVTSETKSAVTWLPSNLMVSASGMGSRLLRDAQSTFDPRLPESVVAATLGVRVDGAWRIDRKALAGLIDSVGGVTVTVDGRMKVVDASDTVVLSLAPGKRSLSGSAASWYAVGDVPGETDAQASARFQLVFLQTLAKIPNSPVQVRDTLTAMGALARSTIGTQDLAEYLVSLSNSLRLGRAAVFEIPTTATKLRSQTLRWVRYEAATPLLRKALPRAQWRVGGAVPPRVLVMSGLGRPGVIASTRTRLETAGYVFVDGRGTPAPRRAETLVQGRGVGLWAAGAAELLGLPSKSVEISPGGPVSGEPWADVDVVLGDNYAP